MKTGERLPAHLKRMLGALPATGQSGTDQSGTDLPMPEKKTTKANLPVTGSPVSVTDMVPVPVTGVPLPETGIACKRKLTIKSSDESEKEILAMYGVGPLSSSSSSRIAPMQTTAAVEISSSEDVSPVKKRGGSPACDRPV